MISSEHTSKQFDSELSGVRDRVLQMGGLVESQIQRAIEALINRDEVLMQRVIDDDHRVNGLEVEIDESCNHIIACRQPTAQTYLPSRLAPRAGEERDGENGPHEVEPAHVDAATDVVTHAEGKL